MVDTNLVKDTCDRMAERRSVEISKEKKLELKSILEKHDVSAFHGFCLDNGLEFVSRYTKEGLSRLMHVFKSRRMYLGDAWQQSRNFLRLERLKETESEWSSDLKNYYEEEKSFPCCMTCKYFRTGPDSEPPCMHIGATPFDICCKAYTK